MKGTIRTWMVLAAVLGLCSTAAADDGRARDRAPERHGDRSRQAAVSVRRMPSGRPSARAEDRGGREARPQEWRADRAPEPTRRREEPDRRNERDERARREEAERRDRDDRGRREEARDRDDRSHLWTWLRVQPPAPPQRHDHVTMVHVCPPPRPHGDLSFRISWTPDRGDVDLRVVAPHGRPDHRADREHVKWSGGETFSWPLDMAPHGTYAFYAAYDSGRGPRWATIEVRVGGAVVRREVVFLREDGDRSRTFTYDYRPGWDVRPPKVEHRREATLSVGGSIGLILGGGKTRVGVVAGTVLEPVPGLTVNLTKAGRGHDADRKLTAGLRIETDHIAGTIRTIVLDH